VQLEGIPGEVVALQDHLGRARVENSPHWRDGGYPIWGEFEVIMDHGTGADGHMWFAHAVPNGLG